MNMYSVHECLHVCKYNLHVLVYFCKDFVYTSSIVLVYTCVRVGVSGWDNGRGSSVGRSSFHAKERCRIVPEAEGTAE